jgi:protein-tyrosine-phosphatase
MAEALARRVALRWGSDVVEVRSAGTSTVRGLPASDGAKGAASRHGLDLTSHESTPLTSNLVAWADHVLAMGTSHLRRVRELGGGAKSALLGEVAQGDAGRADLSVPDPFGGDERLYEEVFETLEAYVTRALERLLEDGG